MSEANKPAYPVLPAHFYEGLTKREYFAAKAMQALVSLDPTTAKQLSDPKGLAYGEWIARDAHDIADAMLAETERHIDMLALVDRVAKLNKDAGEIGEGMLNQLVDEARRIFGRGE